MTRRRMLALAGALGVARCAAPPGAAGPRSAMVELTIVGAADQNPNESGRPEAVAVHLYQLASTARFDGVAPFDLIVREQASLGSDGLGGQEATVPPGATRVVTLPLDPLARYLGVAVLFRDIERTGWRLSAPVDARGANRLTLRLGATSATLAPT